MNRESKKEIVNLAINEYLNTPEKERSLTRLGEKYGIRRQTISTCLKDRGIEVVNQQNRLRINENVFDSIDTEEKAYWLGFIYADGNISSTGNRFEINLAIKDLSHMMKLKDFLGYEEDIRLGKSHIEGDVCRLAVRNKNLWNQLNNKGCKPCKSLILEFPELSIFSNYDLVFDFIRGYVDGDGSLGAYKRKNTVTTELSIVSTENFLRETQKILGFMGGFIRNKTSENWANKAYQLQYAGVNARKVARKLYENANIYMDRKYNIYKLFFQLEEGSSRRKSSKIGEGCDANTEITN
jgi:intein/homing endonuclease